MSDGPFESIQVTAPCRLHFGLLRVGDSERRFGGAGVMLQQPSIVVRLEPAERFAVAGRFADRLQQFVESWSRYHDVDTPRVRMEVVAAPPQHSGLGVGTQLGLSVAAALNTLHGLPCGPAEMLAQSVARGKRSAVGAYGFHLGGLIIERGKTANELLSPLDLQVDLPDAWRFLLVRPQQDDAPVFGEHEQAVFAQLKARPQLEAELEAILRTRLAPAAATGDFGEFAESVEAYGRLAGSYFADAQGGPYNGPLLNKFVARMKTLGGCGVGQSSWGPTLFSCHPTAQDAAAFAERLRVDAEVLGPFSCVIAAASRQGAEIATVCAEEPTHPNV